jgi:hypothetical protein
MKDDAKTHLLQILTAYDARLAETERREAASRAAKAAFPVLFAALKTEMILPVLGELAEVLNGSGHAASAREQEESSSTASGVTSASVALRVIPKPFADLATDNKKSFFEVTFTANRTDQKVVVSSTNTVINSGASVGKRGEYEIGALTADVVVDQVLRALEQAFAGAGR